MKRRHALRACLGIILTGAAANAALVWDATEIRVNLPPGQTEAALRFGFRNEGRSSVRIVDLQASCGCVAATATRTDVPPGTQGSVEVALRLAPADEGSVRRTVTVTAKEGGQDATQTLAIVAQVPFVLHCRPVALQWRVGDKSSSKVFYVTVNTGVKLRSASAGRPGFRVTSRAVGIGSYEVTVTPAATDRPAVAAVNFEVEPAGGPVRTLPFFAAVVR